MITIIPSAKIVPIDLQNLGKLPAIIYPVNQKIVLDYLMQLYFDMVECYEIVAYEAADKIRRRISSYLSNQVRLIELDQLKDLGYTIYFGLKNIRVDSSDAVIINFADTIVSDNIAYEVGDCYFYSEDCISDTWTFFTECDGKIESIVDKKVNINIGIDKQKLFIGVFKIMHPQDLISCFEHIFEFDNEIDSFYAALMEYSRMHPMKAIKTDNWFDIGHADKYYNTQLEVKAREFNHITIDKDRGILKKNSDDKEKFRGEILWYLKLPSDIEYVCPRIFAYSTNYNDLYVEMEYYSYHTLHELFLYGDLYKKQWQDIFNRIKFIIKDFSRYRVSGEHIKESLEDMYLTKTIQRLEKLKGKRDFQKYFTDPVYVNGVKYKSLNDICQILCKLIPEELYGVEYFNIIHGDLCFANIMIDGNMSFIKLIDPRGNFGKFDIYGDGRYELAKLFHSIDGKYDFIIKDLFTVFAEGNNINFTIFDRQRDFDIFQCFLGCFEDEIGDRKAQIEFIEALLFLSMIPLHNENLNHQLVMLGTGLEILGHCVNIRY